MTPTELYHQKVLAHELAQDKNQGLILFEMDRIHKQLSAFHLFRAKIKGLYVWGGVGIGKTRMMDLLCESLPSEKVLRLHFHQFMHRVHSELRILQGKQDPLKIIAKEIAKNIRLICFDEFFVLDIGDAMLLGELFLHLFEARVCMVATSNVAPDDLYKDGLQRDQFLPSIELIKAHMRVLYVDSHVDYRLQHLKEERLFYSPLDAHAWRSLEKAFKLFSQEAPSHAEPLLIMERSIPVVRRTNDVLWVDFKVLCSVPRSQEDYLEIANRFRMVIISDIPFLAADHVDWIVNFTKAIDVFYDARIRVVFSAEKPIEDFVVIHDAFPAFVRTQSRIMEMQGVLE